MITTEEIQTRTDIAEARSGPPESRFVNEGVNLFLLSFMALFLELMFIRWAPSIVRLVAYYANLMLISSFLGLGLGALLCYRNLRLFRFFPLILLISVSFLLVCSRYLFLPGSQIEIRFFAKAPQLLNYVTLIGIFLLNTAVFVPLGERIGHFFRRLPPLYAYGWDLGGASRERCASGSFPCRRSHRSSVWRGSA